MKKFYLALCILMSNFAFASNDIPDFLAAEPQIENKAFVCNHMHHAKSQFDHTLSINPEKRPYDVQTYDLFMDWSNPLSTTGLTKEDRMYSGYNIIKLKVTEMTSTLRFDIGDLTIDSVFVDGNKYPLPATLKDMNLDLNYVISLQKDQEMTVKIHYRNETTQNRGFFLYPKGSSSLERVAYTMSEPNNSQFWMPCNIDPTDKAVPTLTIKVPKEYSVASNGILKKTEVEGNNKIYFFGDNHPMSTYLMAVTASIYKKFSTQYAKVSKPTETVDVNYYVWDADYEGQSFNAVNSFKQMVPMMEYFSSKLVEYPYNTYGMVAIAPFEFGGMEHQTMSSIHRNWLKGGNEIGIVHELAHQWLGDLITCATWNDIWINEGGATWSEAFWQEKTSEQAYYSSLMSARSRYVNNQSLYNIPIREVEMNNIFGPHYVLSYKKAAWVYHMLRQICGEDEFFKGIKHLLDTRKFTGVSTDQFKASFKEAVKKPLVDFDIFFDQWLNQAGHPKFDVKAGRTKLPDGKFKVTAKVRQTQEGSKVPTIFHSAIKFGFMKNNTVLEYTELVVMKHREQTFEFITDLDFDDFIMSSRPTLGEVKLEYSSVTEKDSPMVTSGVYPNPINISQRANIDFFVPAYAQTKAEVFDFLGNSIKIIHNAPLSSRVYKFDFETNDLAPGTYIVRIVSGSKVEFHKFSISR